MLGQVSSSSFGSVFNHPTCVLVIRHFTLKGIFRGCLVGLVNLKDVKSPSMCIAFTQPEWEDWKVPDSPLASAPGFHIRLQLRSWNWYSWWFPWPPSFGFPVYGFCVSCFSATSINVPSSFCSYPLALPENGLFCTNNSISPSPSRSKILVTATMVTCRVQIYNPYRLLLLLLQHSRRLHSTLPLVVLFGSWTYGVNCSRFTRGYRSFFLWGTQVTHPRHRGFSVRLWFP